MAHISEGSIGVPIIERLVRSPLPQLGHCCAPDRRNGRLAFYITKPAAEGGAGADPSMIQTTAVQGRSWVINLRLAFITGAVGAKVGIIMAATDADDGKVAATMLLVDLPDPAIQLERVLDTMPAAIILKIENLLVPTDQILGEPHQGFKYAQVRLSPARLTHCMRWLVTQKLGCDRRPPRRLYVASAGGVPSAQIRPSSDRAVP